MCDSQKEGEKTLVQKQTLSLSTFNTLQKQQNTLNKCPTVSRCFWSVFEYKSERKKSLCLHVFLCPHSSRLPVLAKIGICPPLRVILISGTNISQPQSVSGPITATQRNRAQPDRAATSMGMDLSKPRMSADNIAWCPRCVDPQTAWCLKLQIPTGTLVCLHC